MMKKKYIASAIALGLFSSLAYAQYDSGISTPASTAAEKRSAPTFSNQLRAFFDEAADLLIFRKHQFQSIPADNLLGVEWHQIQSTPKVSTFVRAKDIHEKAVNGLWLRTVPKDGSAEVFEHFQTSCNTDDGQVIRNAEIKISAIDGELQRRKTEDTLANPNLKKLLCPVAKPAARPSYQITAQDSDEPQQGNNDFISVEYRENGETKELESCEGGIKVVTTYERIKGKQGGNTFIASCQTSSDYAPWLVVKREDYKITLNGKKPTEKHYRVGTSCNLVELEDAAKWECETLADVESLALNAIEPIDKNHLEKYFAPIWVKATPRTSNIQNNPDEGITQINLTQIPDDGFQEYGNAKCRGDECDYTFACQMQDTKTGKTDNVLAAISEKIPENAMLFGINNKAVLLENILENPDDINIGEYEYEGNRILVKYIKAIDETTEVMDIQIKSGNKVQTTRVNAFCDAN